MDTTFFLPFSGIYLKAFLLSVFFVWLFTFVSRAIANRFGVVAKRSSRRRHERDTPLMGGAAFYLVFAGFTVIRIILKNDLQNSPLVDAEFEFVFLIALTLVFIVGLIDDWIELKAFPKFTVQIISAFLIMIFYPHPPPLFEQWGIPTFLYIPLGVFCIVGITNAMNMIDGLDGLCVGITAIAALTLTSVFSIYPQGVEYSIFFLMILAGSAIGFLFHNFYPAKIFLGDSGSLLLGFSLAVFLLQVRVDQSPLVSATVPLLILGIPLLDVVFSILRRFRLGRSVFQGDRSHIHHRLSQVGLSHRAVVLLLWIGSCYLGFAAYFLAVSPTHKTIFVYTSVIPSLFFWFIALYFIERRLSFQTAKFGHLFLKQEDSKLRDRHRLLKYVSLQLREYIARVGDNRFIAVLAGAGVNDGSDLAVIGYLGNKIKDLQESYQVFQSHPNRPEGLRVYQFPIEAYRIWQVLGMDEKELAIPEQFHEPLHEPLKKAG
ncbi:MAG: undecaprenyl/decaprenyl-phosphate alpha-N-acetylglucosaminyl 1-phosphate transferase [Deltaproteobacteria bacterium]|nr:undecaprenyl/decaprenyl-phosphate alpha-N-acetylglucosaminyl 1-phosphate transferase [Deltaproteobacteria bacterium]